MTKKVENPLKVRLMKRVRVDLPHFVAVRHEDKLTSGGPDISLTGMGATSWWEVKHAVPNFDSEGIQELTCRRLAEVGFFCAYIIFLEEAAYKETLIVLPRHLHSLTPEAHAAGFDYRFITDFMRKVHNGRNR